ncbi:MULTISPECIES: hypothetical protein [Streptomyces]|uniref:hypothetical protein n=1 Tax=Streptomyces TaxID=1883 RepID=UPI0006EBB205|nr:MULTISPECIES: hypothetical protein [Streptomyces]
MTPTDMGTDMGPTHLPTGHRRRTLVTVPASAESVPQRPQQPPPHQQPHPSHQPHPQAHQQFPPPRPQPHPQPPHLQPAHLQDPPIYRALIRYWADRGRTLPGRHDPEWARLVAPPVHRGQFSGSRDPRGDVR